MPRLPWFNRERPGGREEAPSVPDLNLLPPELAYGRFPPEERRLILIALVLAVLAVVQFQVIGAKAMATGQAILPSQFQQEDPLAGEADRLEEQIQGLRSEIQQDELAQNEMERLGIPWGDLLTYIYGRAPDDVQVETIRQAGSLAMITGTSRLSTNATAFRTVLLQSPAIDSVDLKSLSRDPSTSRFSFNFDLTLVPGEPVEAP